MPKNKPKTKNTNLKTIGLKPIPFRRALDDCMLRLATLLLTGFDVHVMHAGSRYAVVGDDNYSIVAVCDDIARCVTCKTPCLCAETVAMWRRRLKSLGANP